MWLDFHARREWFRIIRETHATGLVTNVDVVGLASYCQAWSDVRRYTLFLRENGETVTVDAKFSATGELFSAGRPVARPEVKMLENAWVRVRAFATDFGFSPSSRSRIALPGKGESTLDDLLG